MGLLLLALHYLPRSLWPFGGWNPCQSIYSHGAIGACIALTTS